MRLCFLTYNIKNARGMDGRVSLPAVASTIARADADVIGLQEVDYHNPRSFFAAQARKLGRMLNMYYVFGPNVTWLYLAKFGNSVLSRYQVLNFCNYPLPSRGEKRGLLRTEINIGGQVIAFYTTHLGLDQSERMQQVDKIMKIIGRDIKPVVLTGDFNAQPDASEIKRVQLRLKNADISGKPLTFPSPAPKYKIDYVFFSEHWQAVETGTLHSLASDHLPLATVLELL